MKVRCGSCRNEFEVAGPGKYSCPVCSSVNVVRDQTTATPPAAVGGYPAAPGVVAGDVPGVVPGDVPPPPPPPPQPPMPKIECSECGFGFFVGEIAVATCPNCEAEVETGIEVAEESDD